MSIILHCGSKKVTRAEVEAVPVPEHTDSWKPVSYKAAIDFLFEQVKEMGLDVRAEMYGLNKNGDQLFAMLSLDTGDKGHALSWGLRQSLNKSLALGSVAGEHTLVCDNLSFSGSAFKVVRKNTTNVWEDFKRLLSEQAKAALGHYRAIRAENDALKEIGCELTRGYEILGVALGEEVLTPHQATVAYADWQTPRYEDFSERTLYSLYNCMTEGLKKGAPGTLIDRHVKAHAYIQRVAQA